MIVCYHCHVVTTQQCVISRQGLWIAIIVTLPIVDISRLICSLRKSFIGIMIKVKVNIEINIYLSIYKVHVNR